MLPARHFNALGINPAGLVGAEEGHYAADVVGPAHAAQGRDAGQLRVYLGVVADYAAAKIGFDGTGATTLAVMCRGPNSWAR